MKSKKRSVVLLATLLAFQGYAQTRLIEKVVKKGNELIIPYEKYQLQNGLTVLVHEDHSDPVAYVEVTYHVGSAREQEGRSGFAHFFEHMMFQGSEHVGDDQHFKILSEAGGSVNGTTYRDYTKYLELIPSNQLETALWLESDRMGYLLDAVTQQKFEIQRATVKNERGQNVDNRPYGLQTEKIGQALYPEGHPYSWTVIGYIDDLNRVDVNDLKKFFLRWYNPNNAILTVSGDVKTADVIKMAEKYFGPIPKGPDVKPQIIQPVSLSQDRYVSYGDNVVAPQLCVSLPTIVQCHEDEAPLEALAYILGGTKSSIFYKNFIKTQQAQNAYVYSQTNELAGELVMVVRGFQNTKLAQMDSLVRTSLAEFEKKGISDKQLKMFKASYESSLIEPLTSVQGKGAALAAYQTFTNDPNYIVKDLKRYKNVTKEDVMRVYKKYVKNKPGVFLSIYPKAKPELVAKPNNYQIPPYNGDTPEREEYKNLVYNKAPQTFDRSKQPIASTLPVLKVPEYWTQQFDNGLRIIATPSNEVPLMTIQLNIEAGHRYEPLQQAGISQLLTSMLNESTKKYSADEISNKLDLLGSSISVNNNGQDIVMTITSLTKNIDSTLSIAQEILFHPKFDASEFARVKKQQLEAIDNMATQASALANNTFAKIIYGNKHIMSVPLTGTLTSVNAIALEDVKTYYSSRISPGVSSMVIVGDLSKDAILAKLSGFKKWQGSKLMHEREPATPEIDKTKIYFVNKEKAPQSEIRIGYMALPFDATDVYYKSTIMNFMLGGTFMSRINMNLRENRGYTYGARTGFSGNQFVGPFTASASVRGNVTDSAVIEFMKELKNYAEKGITTDELAFTKSSMAQSEALRYETPLQKAGFIKRLMDYGLEPDYTLKQNEILKSLTADEIKDVAKKNLPYAAMNIVVVGDKALVFDKLKALGYEVIELDKDGEPVVNN